MTSTQGVDLGGQQRKWSVVAEPTLFTVQEAASLTADTYPEHNLESLFIVQKARLIYHQSNSN